MTEAEWPGCVNPEEMLWFLRGRGGARKLPLLSCACCRALWSDLDSRTQGGIELVEKYAGTALAVSVRVDRAGAFHSPMGGALPALTTHYARSHAATARGRAAA